MIKDFPNIKILALLLLLPATAFPFCFDDAGRAYGVSPLLLQGIARVESNMNPNAVNRNTNGSIDLGLMQVNSFWLKPLGTTSDELLNDACYNVMAGAWILKGCIDRHGETWKAVGCYNAASHDKRVNYSWKVYRELLKGTATTTRNNRNETTVASNAPPRHNYGETNNNRAGEGMRKTTPPVTSMQITVMDTK